MAPSWGTDERDAIWILVDSMEAQELLINSVWCVVAMAHSSPAVLGSTKTVGKDSCACSEVVVAVAVTAAMVAAVWFAFIVLLAQPALLFGALWEQQQQEQEPASSDRREERGERREGRTAEGPRTKGEAQTLRCKDPRERGATCACALFCFARQSRPFQGRKPSIHRATVVRPSRAGDRE